MADQFPYFFDEDYDEETNKKVNMEIMKYSGMYLLKNSRQRSRTVSISRLPQMVLVAWWKNSISSLYGMVTS